MTGVSCLDKNPGWPDTTFRPVRKSFEFAYEMTELSATEMQGHIAKGKRG